MRKFKLTVTQEDINGNITMEGYNEGFTASEIIGFLEIKKQDFIDQVTGIHSVQFKRTAVVDGKAYNISEDKGGEQ